MAETNGIWLLQDGLQREKNSLLWFPQQPIKQLRGEMLFLRTVFGCTHRETKGGPEQTFSSTEIPWILGSGQAVLPSDGSQQAATLITGSSGHNLLTNGNPVVHGKSHYWWQRRLHAHSSICTGDTPPTSQSDSDIREWQGPSRSFCLSLGKSWAWAKQAHTAQ